MVEFFGSCNELVSTCDSRSHKGGGFDNQRKDEIDGSWSGVKCFNDARKLLSEGWQEHVEKFDKLISGKMQTSSGKRISFKNDVQGFAPIVPLALQGVPASMINTRIKPIKAKIIDVYYDISCSCGTSSKDIIDNGLKLLSALIDLELKGYRVNLSILFTSFDSNSGDVMSVKVKDSKEPFALQRMMFPIVHTAFFRVIGFDWYERCPTSTYRGGYGHGLGYESFCKDKEKHNKFVEDVFGKGVMFHSSELLKKDDKYIEGVLTGERNQD